MAEENPKNATSGRRADEDYADELISAGGEMARGPARAHKGNVIADDLPVIEGQAFGSPSGEKTPAPFAASPAFPIVYKHKALWYLVSAGTCGSSTVTTIGAPR